MSREISKQEILNRAREYDELKKKYNKLKHLLYQTIPSVRSMCAIIGSDSDIALLQEIEKELNNE